MLHPERQAASSLLQLLMPLVLGFAFLTAIYVRFYSGWIPAEDRPAWPGYIAYFALCMALWSALEARRRLIYNCFEQASFGQWLWSLAQIDGLTLALVSSAAFFWRTYSFSRWVVVVFWVLHFFLCALAGLAARAWAHRSGTHSRVCVVLAGGELSAEMVRRECLPVGAEADFQRVAGVREAVELLRDFELPPACCEMVVAVSGRSSEPLAELAEALDRLPVPAAVAIEGGLSGLSYGAVNFTPSFAVVSSGSGAAQAFDYIVSKRALDLVVSLTGLILLAPCLAAIACVTWLRSGRPVLFAQQRVGRGGRRFSLYKFRTLPVLSLAEGDRQWTPAETDGWGRFLRSTGLDELPQLFNVLRGEMSLVGPRPERPHFVEQFRRHLVFYSMRHRFQVGITGWAQVNGWRGDTSISRRVEHDLYYLRHWSLALDVRILWMTLADFLRRLRRPPAREERGTRQHPRSPSANAAAASSRCAAFTEDRGPRPIPPGAGELPVAESGSTSD